MRLETSRETLLKPLQLVMGVVERKQTLPILSNVYIKSDGNTLSITGTDLEVELIGVTTLDPAVNAASVTVPGRKLLDISRALPEDAPVTLYQEGERLIIRSGRSRFTLSTLPADDFPNIEINNPTLNFTIPQKQLLGLMNKTHFAIAQQDVRYYLNGLLLEMDNNQLTAVATDGHRLAKSSVQAELPVTERMQIILPRKGVLELMRLLKEDGENDITVEVSTNHITIKGDGFTFTSKLVDARFPDYDRAIPKQADKVIELARENLKQALSRAAILCNEKFRGLRFELRRQLLRILANNPEQEVAEEEMQIDYGHDDLDLGFNVNYLLDVLNNLTSNDTRLKIANSNGSLVFEDEDNDFHSVYVVMPMRL